MPSKLEQHEVAQSEERKPLRAIDLRSDTVTQPTPEMRRAMAEAEVADDVYGEDPTMNRLHERAAEIFQKEAAIFVPSGTMGNQVAIRCHTQHGQEIICEERAHFINLESATVAAFSGCQPRTIYRRRRDHLGADQEEDCAAGILSRADRTDRTGEHGQPYRRHGFSAGRGRRDLRWRA